MRWLRTIEDGIHTYDIFTEGVSTRRLGTKEFAAAVIARLGQKPNRLKPVTYAQAAGGQRRRLHGGRAQRRATELKGIDVFVYWPSRNPNELAAAMGKLAGDGLELADDRQSRRESVAGRAAPRRSAPIASAAASSRRARRDMAQIDGAHGAHRPGGIEIAATVDAAQFRRQGRFHAGAGAIAMADTKPLVAVIMGSKSDWDVMRQADEVLSKFGVAHECRVLSAHRTPARNRRIRQPCRRARGSK